MSVQLGSVRKYELESQSSKYLTNRLRLSFCDNLALEYAPIVYGGRFGEPKADALYYRLLSDMGLNEICLQYYMYWPEQICTGGAFASHRYDYEPIFLFLRPPGEHCYKAVNGGFSSRMDCRFHKTEIHMTGASRDDMETPHRCRTSPAPFYPFGGEQGQEIVSCVKQYPLEASVYFLDHHPVFGLRQCSHVFSGDAEFFSEPKIDVPLRRLADGVLDEWYFRHYEARDEEPFGHDVSNVFEYPHVKYFDPKSLLRPGGFDKQSL